jgi:glycosyltransferase involved in cell wall biosynthesis
MQPGTSEGTERLQPIRSPRAVFGLPAYNHAHKLRETLDSLLAQTERDFCILASDDQSTDETMEILADYASRDDRLIYRRSEDRLGYIGNARRCFELARALYPEAEYFAWASDHDVWHQRWLEALMRATAARPAASGLARIARHDGPFPRISMVPALSWSRFNRPANSSFFFGEAPSLCQVPVVGGPYWASCPDARRCSGTRNSHRSRQRRSLFLTLPSACDKARPDAGCGPPRP